ncbi:MAG TPA: hopanoid-associated sugar epimerase [Candidatus Acidoferrales bacterium]|nr:hopanoid-associated sugar epimerase [Candidatus Acidoferrales bacterium]
MTTLVTGATGFVGSHVARLLAERGEPLRVLVRPTSRARMLDGIPCQRVIGDLCRRVELEAVLRGVRRVFHVAADYRLWSRDPAEIYRNNVEGTRNLLSAARDAGVEQFVYTSTVATMAVPTEDGRLPDESTPASLEQMVGHYKRSKFIAEREVQDAAREGMPVVIVNPTTPVGPGDWKPTPTGRIVVDFLNGRMPAFVDTGLNLVAVEDVAAGHLLAAERGKPGERYILGCRNMTLREILGELAWITGRPAPRVRIPHGVAMAAACVDTAFCRLLRREPHIPLEGVRMARHRMFVETSKAERELGFQPGPIAAALERAVRWYQSNGYVRGAGAGEAAAAARRAA